MEKFTLRASLFSLVLFAGSAHAGSIGSATVNDVTLAGISATLLSYGNGINPQGDGPSGGSTGFNSAFSSYGNGAWTKIASFGSTADDGFTLHSDAFGSNLSMSFDNMGGRNGTWTLTNNDKGNNINLDLVIAIHTGGGSGAWLFDEQSIGAGQKLTGSWALNLRNNPGNLSGYSNLTMFARNFDATKFVPPPVEPPVTPTDPNGGAGSPVKVPEPGVWATLLLGLGMLGFMRRRKA